MPKTSQCGAVPTGLSISSGTWLCRRAAPFSLVLDSSTKSNRLRPSLVLFEWTGQQGFRRDLVLHAGARRRVCHGLSGASGRFRTSRIIQPLPQGDLHIQPSLTRFRHRTIQSV